MKTSQVSLLEFSGEALQKGLPRPLKFSIVTGKAEGKTPLTAFDKALLSAGIGNVNIIKVSSILPPGAIYLEQLDIPPGSLLPMAYSSITSKSPGAVISAAVGVGISGENEYGVIMEFAGKCSRQNAEMAVSEMVREAFAARGVKLNHLFVKGIDHRVKNLGCVFAAVPLWY